MFRNARALHDLGLLVLRLMAGLVFAAGEQWGVNMPWRGWVLDADAFHTRRTLIATISANRICSSLSPSRTRSCADGS